MRTLLTLAFVLSTSLAHAASFVLDSGFLFGAVGRDFDAILSMQGQSISISGGATPSLLESPALIRTGSPGSPFDLTSTYIVSSDPRTCRLCGLLGVPIELQVGGQTFKQTEGTNPPQRPLYSGVFEFTSFTPNAVLEENTAPFIFRGSLVGHDLTTGEQIFSHSLFGQGTTTALLRGGGNFLETGSIRYDFVPIPEPIFLVLFGTGLAILASRRMHQNR
jgi:hypothetical protein